MAESAFSAALGFDLNLSPDETLNEINRRIASEPELGRHLLPSLLPLAESDSNDTRHWFLRCAYAIVAAWRGPGHELIALIEATRGQLYVTSTTVVAQAIRLATALTPVAFRLCCHGEADANLWSSVDRLKSSIMELAASSIYDSVRLMTAKFFGMLVSLFSSGPSSEISVDICSPQHPFLRRQVLEQESGQILNTLLLWIPTVSVNVTSAIINILGILCLKRPQCIPSVVSPLLGYYASPPSTWSSMGVRYYHKNLKVMLMSIFKNMKADMDNAGEIVAALKLLGLEQEMMHHQHRKARMLQKNAAAQAAQMTEEQTRLAEAEYIPDVTTLSSASAAQLATDRLSSLSDLDFRQATASVPFRQLSIVGISDVVPPRKKIRISTRDPRHRDVRFTDWIQTITVTPPVKEEPVTLMASIDESKSIAELREALIRKEAQERGEDVYSTAATSSMDTSDVHSTKSTDTINATATTSSTSTMNDDDSSIATNLQGPETLSANELIELRGECYDRLLQDGATSSIGLSVWMQIVVRLTTRTLHKDDQYRQRLWTFIQQNIDQHQELSLNWLYEAWHKEDKEGYNTRVEQLFELAVNHFITNQLPFNDYIQSFPHIPDSLLTRLDTLFDTETSLNVGIDTLSTLSVQRPPIRQKAFNLLLNRCVDQDATIRSTTIKQLITLLPQVTALDTAAQSFARRTLNNIINPIMENESVEGATVAVKKEAAIEDNMDHTTNMAADSGVTEPAITEPEPSVSQQTDSALSLEDRVIRSIALYFAICAENHTLLSGLFDVYIQCTASVQRIIRQQLYSLIKSIGMHSDYLLELLQTFPKGGETLALRILIILTDKVAPSSRLVQMVKKVYKERELDARFLIPIVSGLDKMEIMEALPKIINLLNNTEHERKIVREVLLRILTATSAPVNGVAPTSAGFQARLRPSELLVALHTFDEQQVGIRKAAEATQICFGEKTIFTAEVLTVVLQQLLDRSTLPTLFMRTVLESVKLYPSLNNYVITLLQKLIAKQVWTNVTLWQGFIRCCNLLAPKSFDLIFQLPKPQLIDLMNKDASLKSRLRDYAQQKREQRTAQTATTTTGRTATPSTASNISIPTNESTMTKDTEDTTAPMEEEQKENINHSDGLLQSNE